MSRSMIRWPYAAGRRDCAPRAAMTCAPRRSAARNAEHKPQWRRRALRHRASNLGRFNAELCRLRPSAHSIHLMAADEFTLLTQYAADDSQEAYRQLVERYAGLVYAAARRQVRDMHLAEDVTQAVFIVLSRKAGSIRRGQPLSAWLLTTTRYTCINALRVEKHRRATESRAAQMRSDVTWHQSNAIE